MCCYGAWPVLFLFPLDEKCGSYQVAQVDSVLVSIVRDTSIVDCHSNFTLHLALLFACSLLFAICYCSLFVNCTMVFGVGLIINAVLVAIPVGGSVGALMGIDAHRAATGQKPLFTGGNTEDGSSTGGGNGGSGSTGDGGNHNSTSSVHGTQSTEYCDLSWGITPPSKSEQYTRE